MDGTGGLHIRRHERAETRTPCRVTLTGSAEQDFRFAASSGCVAGFEADVHDIGVGGLALATRHFLPQGARLTVRVHGPDGGEAQIDVRVRRCKQVSSSPEYLIGTQFIDADSPAALALVATLRDATPGRADPSSRDGQAA